MRTALLLSLLSTAAWADSPKSKPQLKCTLQQGKGDLLFVGESAVIEPGKKVKDVVVIDGHLVVKKGAHVGSVLVSNGDATIEKGAKVDGSVVSVGGKTHVARRTDVKEAVISLDDSLHVDSEEGQTIDLRLAIDGKSLAEEIAEKAIKEFRGCTLVRASESKLAGSAAPCSKKDNCSAAED